jgi:hypothetical protein
MPPSPSTPSTPFAPAPGFTGPRAERLVGLVRTLVAEPDPPLVAGIESLDGETGVLHVKTLSPLDPVMQLFGLTAPDSWDGIAVVARGRSLLAPTDLVLGVAVTRDGEAAVGFVPRGTSTPRVDQSRVDDLSGHVPDALRRALGLPNPAPNRPIAELLTLQWLDRLAEHSSSRPGALRWADVVRLHPAVHTLDEIVRHEPAVARTLGTSDVAALAEDQLVTIGQSFADVGSWERLRTAYATASAPTDAVPEIEPGELPLGLTPDAAAWMDDGMFCRWVLDCYPSLDDLRAIVRETLPVTVARRVDAAVTAWGLTDDPTTPAAS